MKNNKKIKESPLFWPAKIKGGVLKVLDETLIPDKLQYIDVKNTREAVNVIRQMKTRAFGQFLVVLNTFLLEIDIVGAKHASPVDLKRTRHAVSLRKRLEKTAEALNKSRPTFPFAEVTFIIVEWARAAEKNNMDVAAFVRKNTLGYLEGIRGRRLERVQTIASIIKDGDIILTHCNVSGELAMAAYIAQQQRKVLHVFATETRPYFQGAKLTCWELKRMGVDVTLVADNAVGSLLADGLVNKVIVGSDRSCANGDFANKIGTYQMAVLAKEFDIPFYVLTQPSNKISTGEDIPIEIRDAKELLMYAGKKTVEGAVKGFYPGFDVIPRRFVTQSIAINPGR